jgi:hypothetical protein
MEMTRMTRLLKTRIFCPSPDGEFSLCGPCVIRVIQDFDQETRHKPFSKLGLPAQRPAARGYDAAQFADAFARYVDGASVPSATPLQPVDHDIVRKTSSGADNIAV